MTNFSYLLVHNCRFQDDTKGSNKIAGKEILFILNLNNQVEPYETAAFIGPTWSNIGNFFMVQFNKSNKAWKQCLTDSGERGSGLCKGKAIEQYFGAENSQI